MTLVSRERHLTPPQYGGLGTSPRKFLKYDVQICAFGEGSYPKISPQFCANLTVTIDAGGVQTL